MARTGIARRCSRAITIATIKSYLTRTNTATTSNITTVTISSAIPAFSRMTRNLRTQSPDGRYGEGAVGLQFPALFWNSQVNSCLTRPRLWSSGGCVRSSCLTDNYTDICRDSSLGPVAPYDNGYQNGPAHRNENVIKIMKWSSPEMGTV